MKKIKLSQLAIKLDSFINILTFESAKRESIQKWEYILKNVDKIDFKDFRTEDIIWSVCGMCTLHYKKCKECELYNIGECKDNYEDIDSDTPLYSIMNDINNKCKPKKEDIKAFINVLKNLEEIEKPEKRSFQEIALFEFLLTYGWAILLVLVMFGALWYFGVLGYDKFNPDEDICEVWECKAFDWYKFSNVYHRNENKKDE